MPEQVLYYPVTGIVPKYSSTTRNGKGIKFLKW